MAPSTRRLRRSVVHYAVLCAVLWALAPSAVAHAGQRSTGKVIPPALDNRAAATTAEFFYGQNTTVDGRTIVLNWAGSAARMGAYDVYKSVDGSAARQIGTTSFAANVGAFSAALSAAPDELESLQHIYSPTGLYTDTVSVAEVYSNLASVNGLLDQATRTVTETRTINLTRAALQRMPHLAPVTGLGFTDVDTRNPRAVLLYSIRTASTNIEIGTVLVRPDITTATLPAASGLREAGVYDGPADLGIIGSTRPVTAPERYDSALTQHEVANDGTVFLTWSKSAISNGRGVQGYAVYRSAVGALSWQRLNDTLVRLGNTQPSAASTLTVPGSTVSVAAFFDDPYYYADTLITSPRDYRAWRYKVCPVDIANQEGTCSNIITAIKRDLIPPSQVDSFTAETQYASTVAESSKVVLTWQYADAERSGVGAAPTFYVTRAITSALKLANWTPVATVASPRRGTVSVTTDIPAVNTPYWYRIQVRDNAGNWSSPSRPIQGAIFDRTPPAAPVISNENRGACLTALPSRLVPPAEVTQVALYRKIGSGTWILIKRFRTGSKIAAAVSLVDTYVPPQTNTPVNYRVEYLDANGNVSPSSYFCVRRGSPNGIATPRFDVSVGRAEKGGQAVTLDFGTSTDVVSRSVVIARPTSSGGTSVVTTTLTGATSTATIPVELGESFRIGAVASALTQTTDISSTLNSTWVRNVNNFLDLNIKPDPDVFLDAPRNMASLGTFAVQWATSNDENCTDKYVPARKVCLTMSAVGYGKTEQPPLAAVFRRISPASISKTAAAVPWIQVTPITAWRRTRDSANWIIEDTTLLDATRTYEYVVIGHSARSYEVLGYYNTTRLTPGASRSISSVTIGNPVDTTTWQRGLPRGCIESLTADAIPVTLANATMLPNSWYTFDPTSGAATAVANEFNLGNDWTYTVDAVYRTRSRRCTLPDPTKSITQIFMKGTLKAGSKTIEAALVVRGTIAGGKLTDSAFEAIYDQTSSAAHVSSAVANGISMDINRVSFVADTLGVVTNTAMITVTLPAHLSIVTATGDPLFSTDRAAVIEFHTAQFSGSYTTTTLGAEAGSNLSYATTPSSTDPQIVVQDEYLPWFFRVSGRVFLPVNLAAVRFGATRAESRFSYAQPSTASKVPDNNTGFVGNQSDPTRDYIYESSTAGINKVGFLGVLGRAGPIDYVTSYPAGFRITGHDAEFQLAASRINAGSLGLPTVTVDYYTRDTDTSYAIARGGRPYLVLGNYLPPDRLFTAVPGFSKASLTLTLPGNALTFGADGHVLQQIQTPDVMSWPGFSLKLDGASLITTLYTAPALPVGMSSYGTGLPKPVQSAWQQVDRGLADESDYDPGLNIHGTNEVTYGCYGSGTFTANFDAYVRMGGFSEHMILDGLGGAAVKNNTTGYDESLDTFSAIYVDNLIVDPSDIRSTLSLPFPSAVSLPLRLTSFNSAGCPVGGDIGGTGGVDLNHSYWNFDQHAYHFGYTAASVTRTKYALQWLKTRSMSVSAANVSTALAAIPPMILQIDGDLKPMAARADDGSQVSLTGVSEWMPDGDYGNIMLTTGEQVFASGLPFTPNDILLSRYYGTFLDKTSKPATMGFGPSVSSSIPSKLKDGSGNLTPDSLATCASVLITRSGCGLQVLDGNSSLSTFGETQPCPTGGTITCVSGAGTAATPVAPRVAPPEAELPSGAGSIGSAGTSSGNGDTLWNPVVAQFVFDQGSKQLDLTLPLVFIANRQGGVLAGLYKSASILPGAELFKSDVAIIVNGRLSSGVFTTDVGAYFGYSASQAALRALATHRPNSTNTGFTSFSTWNDVKDDVKKWSKTFGYGTYDGSNNNDDPVDLLEDMWTGSGGKTWDTAGTAGSTANHNDYLDTFDYLEPLLASASATENYTDATRGITPLKQGSVLASSCVTLKNGHGAAAFSLNSLGEFNITQIAFGSYMDVKRMGTSNCSGTDTLLHVDRVSLNLTHDGEITFLATHVQSDILSTSVYFDVQLVVGTDSGNQRVEGGIKVYQVTLASVKFENIGVVFGIGLYSGMRVGYFGFSGAGTFKNTGASVQFLIGTLPGSSAVLKAQYPSLMSKLAADRGTAKVYSGLYISVSISVPIYNNGCTLEVIATGEVRGWYMKDITTAGSDAYGGYISARLSAEVACLVSAAGQISLEISQVGAVMTFTGQAWVAGGVGDCEPNTWTTWGGRWWGDSWCQQAGAVVDVQYVDNPEKWTVDYDLAVESLW